MSSDKQCPGSFNFTAEMTPDGTITSFRAEGTFRTFECMPLSGVTLTSGTASGTGFNIVISDHAMCRWPPLDAGNPYIRDTDRTFTMVIDRRRS